ncbi:MAG: hypothetical protein ACD_12C00665G0004 [uncultured bacterium]|nr:MAG: hypothetical protein ACD_12C00665G0004 [uncultured bacterium]
MLKLIMKKIIFGIIIVVTVFLIIFFYLNKSKTPSLFPTYIIDGGIYHLMEARNLNAWTKGLMYYKSKDELKGADGMIFIFPKKEIKTFWNKNTYLDLDIYWMNGEKVVGKSHLPSIIKTKDPLTVTSPNEVNRVVEIIK